MKNIILQKMSLRNFKGVRELDIEFKPDITSVLGRNGTGKTTLFDAFTWVLFGKDSQDREKFQLMTLDSEGNEIPRLQHEVTVWLDVDGKEIMLTRRRNEKWTKRRGSAVEEKTGTEEVRLYNDIPCSVKEWNDKIEAICSYDVFKHITSPLYFASQKANTQRDILLGMIDSYSDADVAKDNADFTALLQSLDGKSLAEYKREIEVKKKRIKTELEEYPIRIKESNGVIDSYSHIDFKAIAKEIKDKQTALKKIATADVENNESAVAGIKDAIFSTVSAIASAEIKVKSRLTSAYKLAESERYDTEQKVDALANKISTLRSQIEEETCDANLLTERRDRCIAERKQILAEQLEISQSDFRCPTCGRAYDVEYIEAHRKEIEKQFNERRAQRLEENSAKGVKCSITIINGIKADIDKMQHELTDVIAKHDALLATLQNTPIPQLPTNSDIQKECNNDPKYQALIEKKKSLNEQLDTLTNSRDNNDSKEAQEMLTESLAELNQLMGKKEIIDNRKQLIKTYEEQMRTKSEELAQLEKIEFTITEFAKARIELVEQRINNLFSMVNFRLFEHQLNGGWKETCEATVNGVPYSALNNAMQINAGLDIINTISQHYNITAPVFIDNAESINELQQLQSQVIRLVVTEDDKLTIE